MRRSSHDHLKPEILVLFAEGKKPAEVCKSYPGIPRATVYKWHGETTANNSDKIVTNSDNPVNTRSDGSKPHLQVLLFPEPENEIDWAVNESRHIVSENRKRDPRTAIAALSVYLKALELKAKLETDPGDPEALELLSEQELEAIIQNRIPANASPHYWRFVGGKRG